MLTPQNEREVRQAFGGLRDPVKLVVFTASLTNPDLCLQAERLVREVAALSDRISVEVLNFAIDRDRAAAYGVDQVPALVVEGARDWGIRFYGVPLGYEFGTLVDAIVVASTGEPALSEETRAALAGLTREVGIKVFSTPT
jgi:alkyl hydroperoxide reductase subunit AhpF